ncbi:unnamed protein product [Periconia digitata]|uniref:Uncharacterized protein n=1 Tax=Periconia digitata TaxID=1303443 RepID=A0A9W4ULS3_9PLEO|nr:unnamed protein product [Periconia digitata]
MRLTRLRAIMVPNERKKRDRNTCISPVHSPGLLEKKNITRRTRPENKMQAPPRSP